MPDPVAVVQEVCRALDADDLGAAEELVRRDYPFVEPPAPSRRYTIAQRVALHVRDGFVDRYSGRRLVAPPVLRLMTLRLPEAFPCHPNWKMTATHPAYWDLWPTVDHVVPVARGGLDTETNWVTTSMARNAAKRNALLQDIGWTLHQPGRMEDWDGMAGWFLRHTERHGDVLQDRSLRAWARALRLTCPDPSTTNNRRSLGRRPGRP